MGNELIAIYVYGKTRYYIYGCWDKETPENIFEFYDVYDVDGNCINEGEPFYELPTREDILEFLTINA